MRQRKDKFEPAHYLPTRSDPKWETEQEIYIGRHIGSRAAKRGLTALSPFPSDNDTPERKFLNSVGAPGIHHFFLLQQKTFNLLSSHHEDIARTMSPLDCLRDDSECMASKADSTSEERYFAEALLKGLKFVPDSGWFFSKSIEELVVEAVKSFGAVAFLPFRPDHTERKYKGRAETSWSFDPMVLKSLPLPEKVGLLVSGAVQAWREQCVFADKQVRARARKMLEKVGQALIPDLRGKHKTKMPAYPMDVRQFYYQRLFELYHVRRALLSDSHRNWDLKVKAVSEKFGLPAEIIGEFFSIPAQERYRPLRLKEVASILTDRHFGIAQQTLANILAR